MRRTHRIRSYVWRQRGFMAVILLCTLAGSLIIPMQPWPMKWLVDHVLEGHPVGPALAAICQRFSVSPTPGMVLAVAVVTGLVLFALQSLFEVGATWGWVVGGRRMVYELTEDLFGRLLRRGLGYHSRHGVGDTMSRVTGDSWALYQQLDTLWVAPMRAVLTIGVMLWLMAQLDGVLAGLSLALAPLVLAASMLIGKPIHTAARLKREIETQLQAHLQQTLTGIPVMQVFAQEAREMRRFEAYADAAVAALQRTALAGSLNSLGAGLVAALGTGVVLWVGGQHVLAERLSLGGLLAFIAWFNLLQPQLTALARVYSTWQNVRASFDRMREVFETTPEIADGSEAVPLREARGHVRFENVTAGYEPGQAVLHEITLEVPPGERLAIVGPSGAGKTTLVSLVPRLLDAWAGRVLVDGREVRSLRLRSLRAQVALLAQEPFLFPWTVADNLRYGQPGATTADIEAAARAANAHEFITRLPLGYDTVLGERGATLSGGERQRLAIARAILKQAAILILDEPTSALDAATERLVLEALERLMAGRTTLVIAHRLSTAERADRMVVLQAGRVVEAGTPAELLAGSGLYAAWRRERAPSKPGGSSERG